MAFVNSFFSIAGQKERVSNVGAVFTSIWQGTGVVASTGSKTLNTILEATATKSGILTAAAIGAVAATPVAISAIGSRLAATSLTTKALATGGALIAVPAVVSNPSLGASAAATALKAPGNLATLGSDVGTFTKSPTVETALDLIRKNRSTLGVLAGAAVIAGGASAIAGINTLASTSATRANTAAIQASAVTVPPTVTQYLPSPQMAVSPLTPSTVAAVSSPVAATVQTPKKKTVKRKKKKTTKKKKTKRKSSKRKPKKKSKKKKYKKKKKKKR